MSSSPKTDLPSGKNTSIEESIEQAKRAFALRKYEQAVDHYATALELATAQYGENAPETADLYFAYGQALLENAISQSSVLGKEQTEEAAQAAAGDPGKTEGSSGSKFLSFFGDGDDDDVLPSGKEDVAVDLFGQAQKLEEEESDSEDEGEDAEPEDDFNAAWEVLDLARAIYEKQVEQDSPGADADKVRLKLADTFLALGDVSLETEKFEQAITDYTAALKLKSELLPKSSRQIAEAHYKLSIVLDLTSGHLSDAIAHAEQALESVEARLAELRDALSGQGKVVEEEKPDVKGKGKAKAAPLLANDAIQKMDQGQMEAEVKDLQGLREDLALKVEELKTMPEEQGGSAPEMVARALDKELNSASTAASASLPQKVNDLTSVVKKKKKDPEANGAGKRKAEDVPGSAAPSEKKAKIDSPEP